ncbi:MAG TPA: carboxymuconolactone decarboxylase family protein [Pseudonocardiaceae bacterium]
MFGDFAPALVNFADDVLFGQVWKRQQLSPKERSLVTVASLTTSGNTDQLVYHRGLARTTARPNRSLSKRSHTWPSTPDGLRPRPRWRSRSRSCAAPDTDSN